MQAVYGEIEQQLNSLSIDVEKELGEKYKIELAKGETDHKLRKKLKKYVVEEADSLEKALEKLNKMLDELYKNYESAAKVFSKTKTLKHNIDISNVERAKALDQKKMMENLHAGFRKKYEEEVAKAEEAEKQEQLKRKTVIENLQQRIKDVQSKYNQFGQIKIDKYRENQILKHDLSKCEPHLLASESLSDAQLKKKEIEIEIQMTTMRQKIDMMEKFKIMKGQTEAKLATSKEIDAKLAGRILKLEAKEDEHKIMLTKAHLVFEEYKKALNTLKVVLPAKEREAMEAKAKANKNEESLKEIRKKLEDMEHQNILQHQQLQMLGSLEKSLAKQLEE